MPEPRDFDDFPDELRCDFGPYMAVVSRNHDADTLALVFSPGFDESPCRWIRLNDLRAPELWQPYGKELAAFVARIAPPGTACRVTTEKTPVSQDQVRSFNRYVGSIELAGGRDLGALVDAEMERLRLI